MKDQAAWVEGIIRDCVRNSADNCLKDAGGEKSWDNVLVGFSRGDDPLYAFYKTDIGSFYWLPAEAFAFAYPDAEVLPEELTIISWVLPQRDVTKSDNRKQKQFPAERWIRSRVMGEAFNVRLAGHLVAALKAAGMDAVAPSQLPQWSHQTSAKYSLASNWSERHTAYAAGLGTFGLSDGLITPRGKAMRCGSVIARLSIPPTPRSYREPYAYCLYFTEKKCGKCIGRCPAGAIGENGHDKAKCRDYLHNTVSPYAEAHFGLKSYGCGLCQTAVPCESKIPVARDVE